MEETFKTVYQGAEAEIVEKKSRFIATVRPVHSEEEALEFVAEMKKKYWNASHNCFAFVAGKEPEIQRFSDDGEPQGTAGKPILDVLLGERFHDTAIVVTRYFGGTLLGTGGLVRAYQGAARAGVQASTVLEKRKGRPLLLAADYNDYGKLQYLLGQKGIPVMKTEFTDRVFLEVMVPLEEAENLKEALTEATSGKAELEEGEDCLYVEVEGRILTE